MVPPNGGPPAARVQTTHVPGPENPFRQKLLSPIRWEPKPVGFEKDDWGVPLARFEFADVHQLGDLTPGMTLPGIVTNVTAVGAFVDVGVHQDGLVHVSQLADRFVRDPNEVVRVRQKVTVRVVEVDTQRGRISLSMRSS